MISKERVLAACAFRPPDRIPRFDSFWEYPDTWRARFGPPEGLTDIAIWVPNEGILPTAARRLAENGRWIDEVDTWGRTIRRREGAYFYETLDVPLKTAALVDSLAFDPPDLDLRFEGNQREAAGSGQPGDYSDQDHCVFGKTGGPFLRSTFVRGEEQFLIDIARDPSLARAIADRVGDHLLRVGVEAIRRWSLQDTGIWIFDDMAYNDGPLFSPASFEEVFLPAYRRMVRAYREAGAQYVFVHSDGDIRPLLDMLVDAGVDGINPIEPRANMDIVTLRKRYPRLVLTGGMCNSDTLVNGPIERIESETRRIIDLGRDGGVVIGTHSISPEIPIEYFAAYQKTCETYGIFT